jgi:hypothetical protein
VGRIPCPSFSRNLEINKHCNQQIKHTTIEATNISIKQQCSVSINVETLQAIKQRLLQAVKQAIKKYCNVGAWSLPRLYHKELRLARAVATWCDRHNALVNWLMAFQVMAFALYVFLFV